MVPDSVLVEAARFAPRVVPLRRDDGRIWWMPIVEAKRLAGTVGGLWSATVKRLDGRASVWVYRNNRQKAPKGEPGPKKRINWKVPYYCPGCARRLRPAHMTADQFPEPTITMGRDRMCSRCYRVKNGGVPRPTPTQLDWSVPQFCVTCGISICAGRDVPGPDQRRYGGYGKCWKCLKEERRRRR